LNCPIVKCLPSLGVRDVVTRKFVTVGNNRQPRTLLSCPSTPGKLHRFLKHSRLTLFGLVQSTIKGEVSKGFRRGQAQYNTNKVITLGGTLS